MSQAGQAGSTPPGGGPVNNITGDTGTTVSGQVKLYGHTGSANAGITVGFNGSSTTELDLVVTDENDNTLIGKDAGNATMSIDGFNVGVGSGVLHALTNGQSNVAVGAFACQSVTQGTDNIGIGILALGGVTSGLTNIGIGHYAGRSVVTGTGNIFAGYSTGSNVTGNYNTAVGHNALLFALGCSHNIAIGKLAGYNYATTESNNILVGNIGTVGESNVMRLGTQGSGAEQVNTTYVAGIVGNTVSNAQQVTINSSTGQLGVASVGINSINVQTFTSSGTYTPTSGMIHCIIECVGGGGGGGGCANSGGAGNNSGAGGGAGGYAKALYTAAQIGASKAVTIGAAGAAGAAGNNDGGTGGTTSVGATLLAALGGVGGTGQSGGAPFNSPRLGGLGGTASVSSGTSIIAIQGNAGFSGSTVESSNLCSSGQGANSMYGAGARSVTASDTNGVDATVYGAGGSGGNANNSDAAGGAGSAGVVIITEYT